MTDTSLPDLAPMPEDWQRALAIVAHPDDMEYGAAAAVARWTDAGKDVAYLLVTRGEAGIDGMDPARTAEVRAAEQRRACDIVGVGVLEFLDHADGLVEYGIALRRDLAAAIRRHRPELVITLNHRESFGGGGFNMADHRAVGVATLDAVRDAANRWVFADAGERWAGVRWVAIAASPLATHAVDIGDWLDRGVDSLRAHEAYLAGLGETSMADPGAFLRTWAVAAGERFGGRPATTFELIAM